MFLMTTPSAEMIMWCIHICRYVAKCPDVIIIIIIIIIITAVSIATRDGLDGLAIVSR